MIVSNLKHKKTTVILQTVSNTIRNAGITVVYRTGPAEGDENPSGSSTCTKSQQKQKHPNNIHNTGITTVFLKAEHKEMGIHQDRYKEIAHRDEKDEDKEAYLETTRLRE